MSNVEIYDIEAPDIVSSGDSFPIDVKVRYITLPWWLGGKLFGVFGFLDKNGDEIDRDRVLFNPWWFWGKKTLTFESEGINETSMFSLDVGWTD